MTRIGQDENTKIIGRLQTLSLNSLAHVLIHSYVYTHTHTHTHTPFGFPSLAIDAVFSD